MDNIKFKGIMPALVSPLNEDGSVREKVLRRLIRWHLSSGCSGFYICGATGEGVVMKPESRQAMAEITVDETGGQGTVINHIGAVDLRTAEQLARHSSDIGVAAISSVPPFFYQYGFEEIRQYYEALSAASDVPLLMYASPLAGAPLSIDALERLLAIRNMIGLKWTNPNYYEMFKVKQLNGGNINVINGPDETLLCGLVMGADGGIGSTYNIMPQMYVNLYRHYLNGDVDGARSIQFKVNRVIHLLLRFGVFPGIKALLEYQGYDVGYCTSPMKRLGAEEQELLRREFADLHR